MKKKPTATKRNPQDLTLRNLKALKTTIAALAKRVTAVERQLAAKSPWTR